MQDINYKVAHSLKFHESFNIIKSNIWFQIYSTHRSRFIKISSIPNNCNQMPSIDKTLSIKLNCISLKIILRSQDDFKIYVITGDINNNFHVYIGHLIYHMLNNLSRIKR